MAFFRSLTIPVFMTGALMTFAQSIPPDSLALEGVIVERYYVANEIDAADEDGSAQLVDGAITYRVFLDMKDGYDLQILGGFTGHPLTFNTTTTFFNNEDRGETWGDDINDIHLNKNTVAIDSWLSIGAASDAHWGVLKSDDPDGSIVGGANNDGGSNGVPEGLLVNDDPIAGIPLTEADGLMVGDSAPPPSTFVGDAPEIFNTGGSAYSSENFGLAVLGDVVCPTPGNKILIGQFTTDGVFSFCLNVWLRIPDSLICDDPDCLDAITYYPFVLASDTTGVEGQYRFAKPALCFSSDAQTVDCLGVPDGPALPGTSCDDGIAATTNDVFDANCVCIGEDCLGVLGGTALPGQPCDDGDPDSVNDIWQDNCLCAGEVGIHEQTAFDLSVHPNPTRDLLRIRLSRLDGGSVRIHLRNALGQSVIQRTLVRVPGSVSEVLDLSGLDAGAYFLAIEADGQPVVKRVTKF